MKLKMNDQALEALRSALDDMVQDITTEDVQDFAKRLERKGYTVVPKAL